MIVEAIADEGLDSVTDEVVSEGVQDTEDVKFGSGTCYYCGGSGKVSNGWNDTQWLSKPCPSCGGSGIG